MDAAETNAFLLKKMCTNSRCHLNTSLFVKKPKWENFSNRCHKGIIVYFMQKQMTKSQFEEKFNITYHYGKRYA